MADPVKATEYAIQSVANKPEWTANTQPGTGTGTWTAWPTSAADGVDLDQSPRAHLKVSLRKTNAHQRSARYTITTLGTGSGTHTIAANGTSVTSASASYTTIDAALKALHDAIQADSTVGQAASPPLIDSELLDSSDEVTVGSAGGGTPAVTLRVWNDDPDVEVAFTAFSTTMTSGVVALDADPSTALMRVFFTDRTFSTTDSPSGTTWMEDHTMRQTIQGTGYRSRPALCIGGLSKGHVYLSSLAGPSGAYADAAAVTYTGGPTVSWGPAQLEG